MINVQTRFMPWAGAGVAAAVGDYADMKFKPLSQNLTNGEIVDLAVIAADIFGLGGRYRPGVVGGSDYAVGSLVSSFVRARLTPAAAAVTTTVAPAATTVAGIPASGGSAAFNLPLGGY